MKSQEETSSVSIECRLSDLTTEERQQILDQLRPSDAYMVSIFENLRGPAEYLVKINLIRRNNSVSFSSISGPRARLLPIEYRKIIWRELKQSCPGMMKQFEAKYGPIEDMTDSIEDRKAMWQELKEKQPELISEIEAKYGPAENFYIYQ